MLRLDAEMLDSNVRVNVTETSSFLKRYNLNMTLHILMQHVNNLIIMIIIQKEHNSLKCAVYTVMIVYFKRLMKHLNVKEMISEMKMTLFDSCFNE